LDLGFRINRFFPYQDPNTGIQNPYEPYIVFAMLENRT
jgi:hypothetical protein